MMIKNDKREDPQFELYFDNEESLEIRDLRYAAYQHAMRQLDSKLQHCMNEHYDETIEAMIGYYKGEMKIGVLQMNPNGNRRMWVDRIFKGLKLEQEDSKSEMLKTHVISNAGSFKTLVNLIPTDTNMVILLYPEALDEEVLRKLILYCKDQQCHVLLLVSSPTSYPMASRIFTPKRADVLVDGLFRDFADLKVYMSSQVLRYVLQQFHWVSNSFEELISSIKFLVLDYYYRNPMSFLHAQFIGGTDKKKGVTDISAVQSLWKFHHYHCELIRMCPSFQAFVTSLLETDPTLVRNLLTNDDVLKSWFMKLWDDFEDYRNRFEAAYKALIVLNSALEGHVAIKPSFELYYMAIDGSLLEDDYITLLLRSVKNLNFNDYSSLLDCLSPYYPNLISECKSASDLDESMKRLRKIRSELM